MMKGRCLLGGLGRTMWQIALGILSIAACQSCATKYPAGGPYYYGDWAHYFVPISPTEPLSKAEAQKRAHYYAAFFDSDGRTIKAVKYTNGKVYSETTYSYLGGRSFEERVCCDGKLTVTVYDRDGKEKSSNRTDGGCTIGKQDGDAGQGSGPTK